MEFPILINWTYPFPFKGLLGSIFYFYSIFNRTFCKQTVENLIRCRVLRRLVWVSTVCLCPIKRCLSRDYFVLLLVHVHVLFNLFENCLSNHWLEFTGWSELIYPRVRAIEEIVFAADACNYWPYSKLLLCTYNVHTVYWSRALINSVAR